MNQTSRFLKLSTLTFNLDRIDWIDWNSQGDSGEDSTPCIQIVYGCEYLFLSQDSEDAAILRDYFKLISIEHPVGGKDEA